MAMGEKCHQGSPKPGAGATRNRENLLGDEWPFPADQAEPHPSVNPQGFSDPPQPAKELPWELLAIIQDIADSFKVLADLAADNTPDPNSQPHSLVTLSEAFQSALTA